MDVTPYPHGGALAAETKFLCEQQASTNDLYLNKHNNNLGLARIEHCQEFRNKRAKTLLEKYGAKEYFHTEDYKHKQRDYLVNGGGEERRQRNLDKKRFVGKNNPWYGSSRTGSSNPRYGAVVKGTATAAKISAALKGRPGHTKGKSNQATINTKWISKEGQRSKMVKIDCLQQYLSDGWVIGRKHS